MTLFKRGRAMLRKKLFAHGSIPIVFIRGHAETSIRAVPGSSEFEQSAEYGIAERTESVDFLVLATDIETLPTFPHFPMPGDLIQHVVGEVTNVYEVMAFGSEPCFRYSDAPSNTILRIHTKKVEEL